MPAFSSAPSSYRPLYRIDECANLMADACVADDNGDLVFLSIWARDTAIQHFLARLTLGRDEEGLSQFHLVTGQDSIPVFVGDAERLEKRLTRAYRRTLFGSIVNLWLFDKRCVKPDKANACALAVFSGEADRTSRLWALVQETCPLPLLDHWREPVLKLLQTRDMLRPLPFVIGPLQGYRLAIDVPAITTALGELIRKGVLGVSQ
ncbi:hypothetical protein AGMMS50256_26470 [Betaproteobacteria bacterium]|nr:hypothetical protein AGMMS50256_26470 [Betaproteobacteria bacterium]